MGSLNKWKGIRSAGSTGLGGKFVWGLGDYKSWLWKTVEAWSFGSSVIVECSILHLEICWPHSYLLRDLGTVFPGVACKGTSIAYLRENGSFQGRQLLKLKMKAEGWCGKTKKQSDQGRQKMLTTQMCHFAVMVTLS